MEKAHTLPTLNSVDASLATGCDFDRFIPSPLGVAARSNGRATPWGVWGVCG